MEHYFDALDQLVDSELNGLFEGPRRLAISCVNLFFLILGRIRSAIFAAYNNICRRINALWTLVVRCLVSYFELLCAIPGHVRFAAHALSAILSLQAAHLQDTAQTIMHHVLANRGWYANMLFNVFLLKLAFVISTATLCYIRRKIILLYRQPLASSHSTDATPNSIPSEPGWMHLPRIVMPLTMCYQAVVPLLLHLAFKRLSPLVKTLFLRCVPTIRHMLHSIRAYTYTYASFWLTALHFTLSVGLWYISRDIANPANVIISSLTNAALACDYTFVCALFACIQYAIASSIWTTARLCNLHDALEHFLFERGDGLWMSRVAWLEACMCCIVVTTSMYAVMFVWRAVRRWRLEAVREMAEALRAPVPMVRDGGEDDDADLYAEDRAIGAVNTAVPAAHAIDRHIAVPIDSHQRVKRA